MTLTEWIILLFVVGVILVVAEAFLPTHGLVGVGGGLSIIASVVLCFLISQWLGLAVLLVVLGVAPFVGAWAVKVWPRTFVGRRIVLAPVPSRVEPLAVQIGQSGLTISELRPIGTCEFDGQRVEALSEQGLIEPGRRVKVVGLNNRRPIVRAV